MAANVGGEEPTEFKSSDLMKESHFTIELDKPATKINVDEEKILASYFFFFNYLTNLSSIQSLEIKCSFMRALHEPIGKFQLESEQKNEERISKADCEV